jgi:molybdate transport system substrate-binding protein
VGSVELTIASAASLRGVLPSLIEEFQKQHPNVKISAAYGASGDLRKRVADGAPVDAVLLANAKPVDALVASGDVLKETRAVVATNALVLIGPRDAPPLTFKTVETLPEGDKLAIGDPGAVPAGQYAREAFRKLGKWEALQSRLVFGGNVSGVLAYARRGEVAAAVVYSTEVRGVDDVKVLDRAEGDWAPVPEVVVGVVKGAEHAEQARSFLAFVGGALGGAIFKEHGFGAQR